MSCVCSSRRPGTRSSGRFPADKRGRVVSGGAFADALALDQRVAGDAARERLGRLPRHAGAVADLTTGSYRTYEVPGTPGAGEEDVAAVVALVAAVEHAQQNERPDAFMSLFRTEDPVWTTAHGRRLAGRPAGRDEISAFSHKVLPGVPYGSPPRSTTSSGCCSSAPFYLLAKDGGAWRIAAAQNTQVVSG